MYIGKTSSDVSVKTLIAPTYPLSIFVNWYSFSKNKFRYFWCLGWTATEKNAATNLLMS